MIPVFEPVINDDEIEAVLQALRNGEISGSFGETLPQFEREFAAYIGSEHGIAVNSGTSALQLAVLAAGIKPGDEVLVSASTNIATALAVLHAGAIPIPVDSEATTWNLDLELIESLISEKSRAIIPVHLYGHPVDMHRLMDIAETYNLFVIEDSAESHGATCRGKITGGFGDLGCFSFYANKVITTGEGGMIVTDDESLAESIRSLRNLAFTEPRFVHYEAGFNFRMTGMQAALGLAQLGKIDQIIAEKRRVAHTYKRLLDDIPGLQLPVEMEWAFNVYWMFAVVLTPEFGISRDQLAQGLYEKGIQTRTFFCPMNQQPVLRSISGFPEVPCPVADKLWDQGLYLPSSWNLQEDTIKHIVDSIQEVRNSG
jgi:perosamine synthetase